ncbi:MAG: LemA family protein [Candidatus Sungbacteria bacterium]|nr:LemA family protein [Candidatus Sungbacteria bacterium]
MITLYVVTGIVILVFLWIIFAYNSLIASRNRADEAWSDIEVQLKRRHDLIPNLVETVKGYAAHESGLLQKVTEARTRAMSAHDPKTLGQAEGMLTGALKTLFAVAENYPELKANVNYLELQRELSDTENKVQAARRFYNTNVLELNTRIETFPMNLIANSFGFAKKNFFDADESETLLPKVSF